MKVHFLSFYLFAKRPDWSTSMKFGNLASALAAATLVAAPVAAQAVNSVAPAVERVGAASSSSEKLEGENGILIAILAAAAVITGIIIIADDNDPTSP
tara:strand:- start:5938 stop:6231 length:294 start_codon:yes stop_codon:yes gene_type:complete